MKRIDELITLVKPFYTSTDPAHDWPHIERVATTAKALCADLEVNLECVLAGVYCHDLINLPKDHPERSKGSEMAAKKALPYLIKAGFNEAEITIIQKAIVEHSFSKGLRPSCLEASIVQDADRLDALGAIGILRCAAVNTKMKSTFYDPKDPMANKRALDDKTYMVDHYFVKLFKLPDLMNTDKARTMADKRVEYMKTFLNELMSEV